MPVRPYGRYQCPLRWPIRAAMTSPCTSQQALALAGFPTRVHMCCFPGIRAARFPPMTSLAHRACAVSRAGEHARIVPETRSVRSANRTHGMQHVEPRTRAHVGRPRGNPCVPNSSNTRCHFSPPRGLVESHAERFRAGIPPRRRAREGRSLNAERVPYAMSRETGAVATITLYGAKGLPHLSPV